MAVKPFERYLKDKQEGQAIGEPSGVNSIEEMKEAQYGNMVIFPDGT